MVIEKKGQKIFFGKIETIPFSDGKRRIYNSLENTKDLTNFCKGKMIDPISLTILGIIGSIVTIISGATIIVSLLASNIDRSKPWLIEKYRNMRYGCGRIEINNDSQTFLLVAQYLDKEYKKLDAGGNSDSEFIFQYRTIPVTSPNGSLDNLRVPIVSQGVVLDIKLTDGRKSKIFIESIGSPLGIYAFHLHFKERNTRITNTWLEWLKNQ